MRARAQTGFTLLEVVVAFVVLALILATVFQIFSAGLGRAGDLDEQSRALVLAQSTLAAAGVEDQLYEGETQGESGDRRYRWVLSVRPAPQAKADGTAVQATFDLFRVDVVVAWRSADGRDRQLSLGTMMIGQKT